MGQICSSKSSPTLWASFTKGEIWIPTQNWSKASPGKILLVELLFIILTVVFFAFYYNNLQNNIYLDTSDQPSVIPVINEPFANVLRINSNDPGTKALYAFAIICAIVWVFLSFAWKFRFIFKSNNWGLFGLFIFPGMFGI